MDDVINPTDDVDGDDGDDDYDNVVIKVMMIMMLTMMIIILIKMSLQKKQIDFMLAKGRNSLRLRGSVIRLSERWIAFNVLRR